MNLKDIFKDAEEEVEALENGEAEAQEEVVEETAEVEAEATEEAAADAPEVGVDVEAIAEAVGEKIVKAIQKSQSLSNRDTRDLKEKFYSHQNSFKGFRYPSMDRLGSLTKNQKIVTWFKALFDKDSDPEAMRVYKALIEGTATQGGHLVPEEFRAEVWRCLPDNSVMRRLATILPMRTDTLNIPTLTARPAAYWTAEYASKSTTSAEFGQVVLTPYDLVCLLPVTHQLVADANIDVVRFVTQLFAEAIALAEDKAFFTGSGTGQPTGLRSCSGVASVAAGGVLDFDDMLSLYYKIPQAHRNSPKSAWVANRKVIEILHKVKDGSNRYIFLPAGMSDVRQRPVDTVLGHPLFEQNNLPEDEVWFGDFSYYFIGDRQSLVVETTREGGDAWRRNAIEIKAVERVDGECALGCAFGKITGVQS